MAPGSNILAVCKAGGIAYLLPVLTACLQPVYCLLSAYLLSTACLLPAYSLSTLYYLSTACVYCLPTVYFTACLLSTSPPAYCLLHCLPTVYSAACLLLTSLHAYCVPYWQPTLSPAYCLL